LRLNRRTHFDVHDAKMVTQEIKRVIMISQSFKILNTYSNRPIISINVGCRGQLGHLALALKVVALTMILALLTLFIQPRSRHGTN